MRERKVIAHTKHQSYQLMIYEKRKEMIELGIKYGFTNDLTIQCSQELDQLLNEYYFSSLKQRIKKKNSA